MSFERVYAELDYYDGPREGVADYCGQPHHFESEWSNIAEGGTDTFILRPITPAMLEIAIESGVIGTLNIVLAKWQSRPILVSPDSTPGMRN